MISGTHVLANRLTGRKSNMPDSLADVPLFIPVETHFTHDGSPPHFSLFALRYLNRWIGGGGPVAWPPLSPDLIPLDFYLWSPLKSLVYLQWMMRKNKTKINSVA
jgi:hypothetical protein